MSSVSKVLKDDGARRDAISLHDRSILVEAGAGSGKTAVMAGRIAVMLAEGVSPRTIAAVSRRTLWRGLVVSTPNSAPPMKAGSSLQPKPT